MCRLFGFRSVIKSRVHSSLVLNDNSLIVQSQWHSDGWGLGYYMENAPHVIKSVHAAGGDRLFNRLSGIVTSETVLAHLRKATIGDNNITNTHPFQYGRWIFAHNGNIKDFPKHRPALEALVAPDLAPFILGQSDSELIFFIVLSFLRRHIPLSRDDVSIDVLATVCKEAVEAITQVIGPFSEVDGPPTETYLTFILTNGLAMIGHQGGKPLLYSTYKTRCADRQSCPRFSPECEAPTNTGLVNHLLLSSETLQGDNVYLPLKPHELVGVDHRMRLKHIPS